VWETISDIMQCNAMHVVLKCAIIEAI